MIKEKDARIFLDEAGMSLIVPAEASDAAIRDGLLAMAEYFEEPPELGFPFPHHDPLPEATQVVHIPLDQEYIRPSDGGPGTRFILEPGRRGTLRIRDLHGTPDAPYVIMNGEGLVEFVNDSLHDECIIVRDCEHFQIRGDGKDSLSHGIIMRRGEHGIFMFRAFSQFIISHIEMDGGDPLNSSILSQGIIAIGPALEDGSHDRSNHAIVNPVFHDLKLINLGKEGIYTGSSNWQRNRFPDAAEPRYDPELFDLLIYNVHIDSIGQDGLQVGSAIGGGKIFNNVVRRYGLKNRRGHRSGIRIGPGGKLSVYSNRLVDGGGHAFAVHPGPHHSEFFSNIIEGCAGHGFYVGREKIRDDTSGIVVVGNTFVDIEYKPFHFVFGAGDEKSHISNNIYIRADYDNEFHNGHDDPDLISYYESAANPLCVNNAMYKSFADAGIDGQDYHVGEDSPMHKAVDYPALRETFVDFNGERRPGPDGPVLGAVVST